MAIKEIIEALEEEARVQREGIISHAEKQAGAMLQEAKQEAEQTSKTEEERLVENGLAEEDRIMHQAKFDGQAMLAEGRESLVAEVLKTAHDRLSAISDSKDYERIFKNLAAEACEAAKDIKGDRICIVGKNDEKLASKTLAELGFKADVVTRDIEGGGLIIASADERRRLVNTLSGRLERATPFVKAHVARILFE